MKQHLLARTCDSFPIAARNIAALSMESRVPKALGTNLLGSGRGEPIPLSPEGHLKQE